MHNCKTTFAGGIHPLYHSMQPKDLIELLGDVNGAVISYLTKHSATCASDLAEALGRSKNGITLRLSELIDKGVVIRQMSAKPNSKLRAYFYEVAK